MNRLRQISSMAIATAVAVVAAVALYSGVPEAQAVVTTPIPSDVGPTPPPIPTLPAAGDATPPADAISDPIEPSAACGSWYRASTYGGQWPTSSTWWEYQCTSWYPCGGGGACNADSVPSYWTDYFYWDGTSAVFYGEYYADQYWPYLMEMPPNYYWWDQPTGRWYVFPAPPNVLPTASFTFT
jgi:hypothetical protein